MDAIFNKETWHIINFYHDVQDNTCLRMLLALNIDATTPTLIAGDFNTHSLAWSPPDTPQSSWARQVKEWVAKNLLSLANNPGEVMCRGTEHKHNSVIDLVWFNEAAVQASTFTELKVDWEGSLGSDHALLQVAGHTCDNRQQTVTEANQGFVINPDQKEDWLRSFKAHTLPVVLPSTPTTEEVEQAVVGLLTDIQETNELIFHRRKPYHSKAVPWWNAACALAAQNLCKAKATTTQGVASA